MSHQCSNTICGNVSGEHLSRLLIGGDEGSMSLDHVVLQFTRVLGGVGGAICMKNWGI